MKFLLFALMAAFLAGCETIQKWDDSMNQTEARLQSKNYNTY